MKKNLATTEKNNGFGGSIYVYTKLVTYMNYNMVKITINLIL